MVWPAKVLLSSDRSATKKTLPSTKERVVIQIHVMEIVCGQKLEHMGYIGHMDHIDLWT